MKKKERIYLSLTKLLPKVYVKHFEGMMRYSGEEKNALFNLGASIVLSVLMAIITFFLLSTVGEFGVLESIGLAILAIGLIQLLFFLGVFFKVEKRVEEVEKALPDQLQLMSNNIKAGMTPYNALRLSARKEFGALSEEIEIATNKALGTDSFTAVLLDIRSRIKSSVLERVLKLITSSLKTGGKLSHLLYELTYDIRENQGLKRDLVSKTKTYTAFILFTVVFATPILLSISIHFVDMIEGFSGSMGGMPVDDDLGLGFISGGAPISPEFILGLGYVLLILTAIFASMLLGVINKGKAISGLSYAPPLMIVVLIIFIIARSLISSFFATMI